MHRCYQGVQGYEVIEVGSEGIIRTRLKIVMVRIRTNTRRKGRVRVLTCKAVIADLMARRLATHV